MKAELSDGRKLDFPDSMSEEQVGRIVRAMLAAENAAKKAQADVDKLRGELKSRDDALLTAINDGFTKMVKAQLADRMMVPDDYGELTRSRAII